MMYQHRHRTHSLLRIAVCALPLLAVACTPVAESSKKAGEHVKNNAFALRDHFKDLVTFQPKPKQKKPIEPTYCYRVMQDIMCYREPMAGAEGRLVAYQGPGEEAVPQDQAGAAQRREQDYAMAVPVTPVAEARTVPDVALVRPLDTPATPSPAYAMPGLKGGAPSEERTEKSLEKFADVEPEVVGPLPEVAGTSE
jgi:hypothetical protein